MTSFFSKAPTFTTPLSWSLANSSTEPLEDKEIHKHPNNPRNHPIYKNHKSCVLSTVTYCDLFRKKPKRTHHHKFKPIIRPKKFSHGHPLPNVLSINPPKFHSCKNSTDGQFTTTPAKMLYSLEVMLLMDNSESINICTSLGKRIVKSNKLEKHPQTYFKAQSSPKPKYPSSLSSMESPFYNKNPALYWTQTDFSNALPTTINSF